MSKRSKRRQEPPGSGEAARAAGGRREPGARGGGRGPAAGAGRRGSPAEAPRRRSAGGRVLGLQLAFLAAVFGAVVLVAELAGAANLGVALGIGQIAFAIAVVYLLLRR